jgi:ADP-heptose:LPS heptosyltransferase
VKRVLAVRQDNNGDVLLAGPAVRAVATAAEVTFLCGPSGAAAAQTLPGVARTIVREAAWIEADPKPLQREHVDAFVDTLREGAFDEAIVFTSFHQSPLPLALLLRMAGVPRIGAISEDYPGSLLDVRHRVDDDIHEVERALSLVRAMGYELPANDDRRLRMQVPDAGHFGFGQYVVVHPGCTVPARAWYPQSNAALVTRLCSAGHKVVVTGSASERDLANGVVADSQAIDMSGKTNFRQFALIVKHAACVVSGNTSAAHIAAAMGTPVVSIFPPTVPASRFRPWMVKHVLLGDQQIACAGCRSRVCPIPGQPCLSDVTVEVVYRAILSLTTLREVA